MGTGKEDSTSLGASLVAVVDMRRVEGLGTIENTNRSVEGSVYMGAGAGVGARMSASVIACGIVNVIAGMIAGVTAGMSTNGGLFASLRITTNTRTVIATNKSERINMSVGVCV